MWLSVGMGLVTDSVETASNLPQILLLFLFVSSAFVPTDSMPAPIAWFAEHQPFTPIIETIRGLLFGTPIGIERDRRRGLVPAVHARSATSGRGGCTSAMPMR